MHVLKARLNSKGNFKHWQDL